MNAGKKISEWYSFSRGLSADRTSKEVAVYVSEEGPVPSRGQASVKIPDDKPTNEPIVIHFIGYVKHFPNVDKKYVITSELPSAP
jgi:hypothetical protein